MVRPCSCPTSNRMLEATKDKEHAMSQKLEITIAVIGIGFLDREIAGVRAVEDPPNHFHRRQLAAHRARKSCQGCPSLA